MIIYTKIIKLLGKWKSVFSLALFPTLLSLSATLLALRLIGLYSIVPKVKSSL